MWCVFLPVLIIGKWSDDNGSSSALRSSICGFSSRLISIKCLLPGWLTVCEQAKAD